MKTIQAGWKGILLCLAIAVPAWFLVEFVPALEVVGAPVIAILAGMLLTLALSVGIEVVQPLLHAFRSSDITDVITNTTGGVLGYALWAIVHACRKKRED